jgi:hypothetical protein
MSEGHEYTVTLIFLWGSALLLPMLKLAAALEHNVTISASTAGESGCRGVVVLLRGALLLAKNPAECPCLQAWG